MIDTRRDKIIWNITNFLYFSERLVFFPKFGVFSSFHFFDLRKRRWWRLTVAHTFEVPRPVMPKSVEKSSRLHHLAILTDCAGRECTRHFSCSLEQLSAFQPRNSFCFTFNKHFWSFFLLLQKKRESRGLCEASKQLKITFDRHYFYRRQLSATYPR